MIGSKSFFLPDQIGLTFFKDKVSFIPILFLLDITVWRRSFVCEEHVRSNETHTQLSFWAAAFSQGL